VEVVQGINKEISFLVKKLFLKTMLSFEKEFFDFAQTKI
jgi:hypothetical protein